MKKLILLFSLFFFLMTFAQEKKEINTDTKTENIEKQISDLQKQIKVLEEQRLDKNNIEIIEKVEGFYDRSWEKLIFIISIAGAFVGVVVPVFFNWQQNRNFDKLLEREGDIKKIQDELKKYSYDFQNKIEDFEKKYDKTQEDIHEMRYLHAMTQGEVHKINNKYNKAIFCYALALNHCLEIDSSKNVLLFIIEKIEYVIKNNKTSIKWIKEDKEDTLKSLNHILTSNILPEENERIQKIINFIENC